MNYFKHRWFTSSCPSSSLGSGRHSSQFSESRTWTTMWSENKHLFSLVTDTSTTYYINLFISFHKSRIFNNRYNVRFEVDRTGLGIRLGWCLPPNLRQPKRENDSEKHRPCLDRRLVNITIFPHFLKNVIFFFFTFRWLGRLNCVIRILKNRCEVLF